MRVRHGHIVPESTTLREVAERLIVSDCDVMAVVDASGKLSGIICESSVVRALMANPAENATVQSIVSRHAESVKLDATLASVLPLFRSSANTAIPVLDVNGIVCGLLMRRDVIGSLLRRRLDDAENVSTADSTTATKSSSSSSVIRPPAQRTPIGASAETPPADVVSKVGLLINQPKPHFLRADEARRILWAAEDRL